MTSKYYEEDLRKVRPVSIQERESKVRVADFVDPGEISDKLGDVSSALISLFPDVLKGSDIRRVVEAIRRAREEKREIIWMVGAHVLKCGLSLFLNGLIDRGFVTAVATTGSAAVHDLEIAFFGETSEDVAVELPQGRFGMSKETAEHFEAACHLARDGGLGLGEGIGKYVSVSQGSEGPSTGASHLARFARFSVFRTAYCASVPAACHVAFGTDIVHQHPGFPSAVVGELSMRDFRILTGAVGRMFDRGVAVLFGSAVVLPEVFLKAVSVGYNLGKKPKGVTAVSFDMLQHYRVRENVLTRPFHGKGRSYSFTGHHEFMLPLLYHLLVNE